MYRKQPMKPRTAQSGLSLVELMIAMLIGLLVVVAAGGVFLANKRVYASTETLNRIQEGTRAAFELMSRDIREAGGNPCSASAVVVNQLSNGSNTWWTGWMEGIHGYDGTDAMASGASGMGQFGSNAGQRVSGTDAVEVHGAFGSGIRVTGHAQPSAVLDVGSTTGLQTNDILMVCNMDYAFVFQATGLAAGNKIQHNGGSSLNCAQEFQYQSPCTGTGASGAFGYCFVPGATPSAQCIGYGRGPAFVAKVQTVRWFVGNNSRGGRSLYRASLANRSNGNTPDTLYEAYEVIEGVEDMQITYLETGASGYVAAGSVTDWSQVLAVRIEMLVTGTEGALSARETQGVDGQALRRRVTHVVQLRNREATL